VSVLWSGGRQPSTLPLGLLGENLPMTWREVFARTQCHGCSPAGSLRNPRDTCMVVRQAMPTR